MDRIYRGERTESSNELQIVSEYDDSSNTEQQGRKTEKKIYLDSEMPLNFCQV